MLAVSRLTWIERDRRWRAGPYEIELAAPQLWVCTRRGRSGLATVEATSGSLAALKARIEKLEYRRSKRRSSVAYLAVFLLSIGVVVAAATANLSIAPLLAMVFSTVALWAILKSLDCVIRRSWESLNLTYQ